MLDKSQIASIIDADLLSSDGSKLGKIGQVYVDDQHDEPEWVTVSTGLFGTGESFVPLAEATLADGGVTVPYTKDQVKNAPNVSGSEHLSEAEERELYEYYGVRYSTEGSTFADTGRTAQSTVPAQAGTREPARAGRTEATTGLEGDTGDTGTDGAMTRSEERLNVGTEQVQGGKARLRKYIVTENVTRTVPVSHEELRIEREPITEADRTAGIDAADLSEEEHELTLNREQVVVSKETVPVERVRMGTDTVTEDRQVDESVRKEQIDVDSDSTSGEGRLN